MVYNSIRFINKKVLNVVIHIVINTFFCYLLSYLFTFCYLCRQNEKSTYYRNEAVDGR